MSELSSKKLTEDQFFKIRETVLDQWPTGKDVDFDDAVAYHKELPETKVFSKALDKAKAANNTLIQPRAGVALICLLYTSLRSVDR